MRKTGLIILILLGWFGAKAQSPVIISQPYIFNKYVHVKGSLFSDTTLSSLDSSNRVPNTAWVRRNISGGGGGGGITTNPLIINNSGSGASSGSTFNGASPITISYNSIGAQPTLISGTNLKTINSVTLLGSSNILLQTPLIAGTDYLTPTGSAALLTSFPTFNQNTTGQAGSVANALANGWGILSYSYNGGTAGIQTTADTTSGKL